MYISLYVCLHVISHNSNLNRSQQLIYACNMRTTRALRGNLQDEHPKKKKPYLIWTLKSKWDWAQTVSNWLPHCNNNHIIICCSKQIHSDRHTLPLSIHNLLFIPDILNYHTMEVRSPTTDCRTAVKDANATDILHICYILYILTNIYVYVVVCFSNAYM